MQNHFVSKTSPHEFWGIQDKAISIILQNCGKSVIFMSMTLQYIHQPDKDTWQPYESVKIRSGFIRLTL